MNSQSSKAYESDADVPHKELSLELMYFCFLFLFFINDLLRNIHRSLVNINANDTIVYEGTSKNQDDPSRAADISYHPIL